MKWILWGLFGVDRRGPCREQLNILRDHEAEVKRLVPLLDQRLKELGKEPVSSDSLDLDTTVTLAQETLEKMNGTT